MPAPPARRPGEDFSPTAVCEYGGRSLSPRRAYWTATWTAAMCAIQLVAQASIISQDASRMEPAAMVCHLILFHCARDARRIRELGPHLPPRVPPRDAAALAALALPFIIYTAGGPHRTRPRRKGLVLPHPSSGKLLWLGTILCWRMDCMRCIWDCMSAG